MKAFLCTVAVFAATIGATGAADDVTVITVEANDEGKLIFPKVQIGQVVRFRESCPFANGAITVTAKSGAKLERQSRCESARGGAILLTGMKNMEYEIKAEKAGTAKITVAVKNGDETVTRDYELIVEESK